MIGVRETANLDAFTMVLIAPPGNNTDAKADDEIKYGVSMKIDLHQILNERFIHTFIIAVYRYINVLEIKSND